MNKKVLTLCAAMLLSGSSLVPLYADNSFEPTSFSLGWKMDFDNFVKYYSSSVSYNKETKTLTVNDEVTYTDLHKFLLIDEDNVVLDGQGKTWNGRIVVTGENVTIKNLTIDYKNAFVPTEDATVIENKSAITVFASNVTIDGCEIKCSVDYPENYMANGIVLYPLTQKPTFKITNTTISGANSIVESDGWPDAPSFGIQILGNLKDETSNGFTYFQSDEFTNSASNLDLSNCVFPESDEYVNCATDFGYIEISGMISNETRDVESYKIVSVQKNSNNELAVKKAITNAAEGATIKFDGTGHDLMVALNGMTLAGSSAAVQCTDKVMLIGDAPAPEGNTLPTETVDVTKPISAPIQSASWGQYEYFKQATDALKNGSETLLVLRGAVLTTTSENGKSSYWLNLYKPSDLQKDEINKFKFTFDVVETVPNTSWEIRLKDGYGKYFVINNAYVTVDVDVTKDSEGNYLFNGKEYLPVEFGLKAGSQYLAFDWAASDWKVVSNIWEAQAFGTSTVGRAFMYAETLLNRYGEYFKLKLEYDKDVDGTYETDLTSIFAGELTPVKNVWYYNGNTGYDLADPKAREFMLINEKNQILVVNTDPKTAWSSGNQIHAYKLELIDARTYELDQRATDHAPYYKTNFTLEYKPSAAGMVGTTDIVAIYVDGREVGCYLDKQEPVLAATGNTGALKDVKITLNPSALVKAESWLTSPVYYKVTVKNQNEDAQYYGKVLGLDENGDVTYVAPENVDQTRPEGQFAIEWTGSAYKFTNRENGRSGNYLNGGDFYEVDKSKNLFAYRNYQYNLMDTLEIAPISTYTNADGFKRFTAEDLNNNTYTVSMMLLNGDSLNVIENHNDKHRVGLDEDKATEWRIEMPTVKLNDKVGDFLRLAADTVTKEVSIRYYVGGTLKETTIDAEQAEGSTRYVYNPNAALKICTYILKNTDTNEYLYGKDGNESKGNAYYVCEDTKKLATRVAFKLDGKETINLVPAYNRAVEMPPYTEDAYKWYADELDLSNYKIIGGATSLTGVLKDVDLYEATTNDLFVISTASAPTYKKLTFGDKIAISRLANKDEVIYEKGEFAGINNRAAYKDINPTLFVDTAYVEREGNFKYQYLLTVNPTVNPAGNYCEEHDSYTCEHGVPFNAWTEGRYLVNMVDSAEANKDVHNNKFEYNEEYKLAFVNGYHRNDTLYITNEAGEVTSKMSVGDANSNIAKFAFKMVDEEANEFVIETGTGYNEKKVYTTGAEEVTSREMRPAYLRWVNGNLVVTENIKDAERFTMEASDKEATANENIAAGNVVVAGVDGAVVVKGAEGKNVIVSTILGKVVANEVVSSDNATIAAPAGIVVVSVDGESFKVVVK